jgi:protein-tyrosine-phosphatase
MREVGIDITDQTPRKLEYATAQDSDVIILVAPAQGHRPVVVTA